MALVDNPRLRERGNLESLLGRLQLSIIDIPPDGNWCGQKSAVIDFLSLVLKRFLPSLIYLSLSSLPLHLVLNTVPYPSSLSVCTQPSKISCREDSKLRYIYIYIYIPERFSVVANILELSLFVQCTKILICCWVYIYIEFCGSSEVRVCRVCQDSL